MYIMAVVQRLAIKTQTEARSWQQLTLSTSGQWEVVAQSWQQCICELQGGPFSSLSLAAFCINEVEFTSTKINFVCVCK